MRRRRGRMIGTILVGLAILASLAALFFPEQIGWRTMPHPVKKAEVSQTVRTFTIGSRDSSAPTMVLREAGRQPWT